MKSAFLIAALIIPAVASAGDLQRDDPLRKTMTASIRASERYSYLKGTTFHIKRIWVSGNWGYLCGLVIDKYGYHATDEQLDLYRIILKRDATRWRPVAGIEGFVEPGKQPDCAPVAGAELSEAVLEKLTKEFGPL